jgi:hypothetical protein
MERERRGAESKLRATALSKGQHAESAFATSRPAGWQRPGYRRPKGTHHFLSDSASGDRLSHHGEIKLSWPNEVN